ncbi:D-galacturonic acid reductase, partial [Metarhizium majus ARSEF 297]
MIFACLPNLLPPFLSICKYVDLLLTHWPVLLNPKGNDDKFPTLPDGSRDIICDWNHVEAWKQMEQVFASGKARAIGVCNYSKKYLEELLPHAKVVPAVNQIENHPSLPQQEIVDLCNEKGIHVMAYSPLGSTGGPMMSAAPVVKLAEKKGVSPSTVLLSYHVARGSTVLPKSVTPARIKANLEIVKLDADDMKVLTDYSDDLTNKGELKRYVYPPFGINFGFPDKQ